MSGRLRVLVVDDDAMVREVLEAMLEDCDVTLAADGEEALTVAGNGSPDVVLLDIMMPGLDGYEVCRRLKSQESAPRVIMLTAKTSAEDEQRGRRVGADDYLRKPFSPLEVLEKLGIEAA